MIKITDPSECCGCSACASICPRDAIYMKPDALGFLYPEVDMRRCIGCGQCDRVCAFNDGYDRSMNLAAPDAYAARHKDMHEVETSQSGAAFIAVSDWILKQGGAVYGAGYADHFRVIHKRALTEAERDEFKGSKYVQSDMGSCFRNVRQDLEEGRPVLFVGTPCQTSGLNAYIGRHLRENLYLADIVCHGVPGPRLWSDYLSYIERKTRDSISRVNFRDKQEFGWAANHETFEFGNGAKKVFPYKFYRYAPFRKSCAKCHFCNTVRPSDITMGDFWGWEKAAPGMNMDDKGISLILVNTEKGRRVFDEVRGDMEVIPARIEDCLQFNLRHPTQEHRWRDDFEKDYVSHGFSYVAGKYGDIGWRYQIRRIVGRVRRVIRMLFKI